jgi:hypothetical protein
MTTQQRMPEGARVALETFQRMIAADEGRRRELVQELTALSRRQRELAESQDASWVTEGFIQPRLDELRTVVSRLVLIRGRLAELQAQWGERPVSLSCYETPAEYSPILCVAA